MKVAIVVPPYPLEEAPAPPLGITYVAAAFESARATVRIFDYLVTRYSPEKLRSQIDAFQPDVMGSTSVTLNFPVAADILKTAKRYRPTLLTLMGGPHVSFADQQTLEAYPEIDLVVRGEGEKTISELMASRMHPAAWPEIRGLSFRMDGRIRATETQPFIEDLDRLPLPARHLLPLSRYRALGYPISIITSRGCPYSCIFCLGRKMVGNRVRQRSASLVADEIEQILSYGIERINVADDLFVSHSGKVKEVCDEILKRGLKFSWSAFARVNTVDRETLLLMRRAGCDSVSFGVESGNVEMLKRIKKGITLEQVSEAVSLCKEAGIIAHTSFIVGLPGETLETLNETSKFADGLGSLYGYHFLTPFPGTTIREECHKYDLEILTDDWTRYDANSAIVRTSSLSPLAIERFVGAFESKIQNAWEAMVQAYHQKTNRPEIDMQVEGHFRMKLIYRLLSEDLIEGLGKSYAQASRLDEEKGLDLLCGMVEQATGDGRDLVGRTLRSLVENGYIKYKKDDERGWYWTHNRHVDQLGYPQGVTESSLNRPPAVA